MPESHVGASKPDVKKGNKVAPTTKASPAPTSDGHGAPGEKTNAQKQKQNNPKR